MIKYKNFIKKIARKQDLYSQKNLHYFSILFSTRISFWLYKLRLSADFILLLFFFIGILSNLFLYYDFYIISYILFRFHIILDICDGNLARANKTYNVLAPGLDKVTHFITNNSLLFLINYKIGLNFDYLFIFLTFNLSYLFSNLFKKNVKIDILENKIFQILKDLISLEGYLLFSLIILTLHIDINFYLFNLFFITTFSLMLFSKFNRLLLTA